ncbi:MAG: hypothetical protein JNM66_10860 [Bryobacterales bacterium]|nr:hypothetical protein [Bryobacterales bacterium]
MRRRHQTILLCSDLVQLEWADDRGISRHTAAILEEIKPSGAVLFLESDRPPGQAAPIRLVPCGYTGRARRCRSASSGFLLEVAFDRGIRWCADQYQPSHPFDPKTVPANAS